MAKQQTFGDKLKKKKQTDELISVRVVQGLQSELRGTVRFVDLMVKVKDLNELEKIDITKF
ncbi:hypothetical protein D9V86_09150 [Bacteroidetes/Chlorobi group bacterium ChocPot_Mid]|jgi:hypothetical protein|nr:MAG: hypothetical protein D9V86_09150 [Bacteroidetes/Chlorobi group bacterium ChocPot_Mid]